MRCMCECFTLMGMFLEKHNGLQGEQRKVFLVESLQILVNRKTESEL